MVCELGCGNIETLHKLKCISRDLGVGPVDIEGQKYLALLGAWLEGIDPAYFTEAKYFDQTAAS